MRSHRRALTAFLVILVGIVATAATASFANDGTRDRLSDVEGTIWVANRGVHTIQGFDARTGGVAGTIAMTPGSQPGSRVRERQALRRRGVREPAGDRHRRSRDGRHHQADLDGTVVAASSRAHDPPGQPRGVRAVRDGRRRRRGHPDGHAARPVGHERRPGRERPGPRRRVLLVGESSMSPACVERDRRTRSQDGCHPLEPDGTRRARSSP